MSVPVEPAKPNLKVGGTAPFVAIKFEMSISVSPGSKVPLLFKSMATARRPLGSAAAGNNVIWTLLLVLASVRLVAV